MITLEIVKAEKVKDKDYYRYTCERWSQFDKFGLIEEPMNLYVFCSLEQRYVGEKIEIGLNEDFHPFPMIEKYFGTPIIAARTLVNPSSFEEEMEKVTGNEKWDADTISEFLSLRVENE